jgi:heat shock protein HslJ
LQFDENFLNGFSGANNFNAPYEANQNLLSNPPLISTKILSLNPIISSNEQEIYKILNDQNKSFEFQNKTLIIKASNGTLEYKRANPLKNSSWKLISPSYENETSSNQPCISFSNDEFYGFNGVNNYFGKYENTGNNITISNTISTQTAAIAKDTIKFEQKFMNIILSASSFEFSSPTILNINSPEGFLVFEIDNPILEGSKWELVQIDEEVINVSAETLSPTLEFKDNAIFGKGGINSFRAAYALEYRNIFISPIASTLIMGGNAVSSIEKRYLSALNEANSFDVRDTTLIIRGKQVLLFKALK